jgi:uncharacterized protein (TIGR02145 family)
MSDNTDISSLISQAEQGDAEAQYNLGVAYVKGDGVSFDVEKAKYWYAKAANNGHVVAKLILEQLAETTKQEDGIGCKDHPSKKADAYCEKCGDPICEDCHLVLKYCYRCATNLLNSEIAEYKDRGKLEKGKRIWVIFFSYIGLFFGVISAIELSKESWGLALACIWICLGIGGNFRVFIAEFIAEFRMYNKNVDFWTNLGISLFAAVFSLLLRSLAGPIIPMLKINDYTINVKTVESTVAIDTKLLGKMVDYYKYTQYIEKHGGNVDLAKLTEQGGELFNNKYAQIVLQKGEEEALLGFMSDIMSDKYTFFIDPRDGKTYKTVKIGNQTWMAENLNYEAEGSKCYNNDPANGQKYGRLYNWETAKKACPPGWHLPSDAEWTMLEATSGCGWNKWQCYLFGCKAGIKLKATSGWNDNGNGVDAFGFAALPGGYGFSDGNFRNVGEGGGWWSATENSATTAWDRYMIYLNAVVGRDSNDKTNLYSVRCVQD